MHNYSKGYRKFHSRLLYFKDDAEAAEIVVINKELLAGDDAIFKGVNGREYPRLNIRNNAPGSRENVLSHMRQSIYVSCIKELYEEVMQYCEYAMRCAALTAPDVNRLIGEQNDLKLTANDILNLKTREEIVSIIMKQVFRRIENKRDTLLIINALNDRLALGVDPSTIDNALPFLEARHIFVHADGHVDETYKKKYPKMKSISGNLVLNKEVINRMFSNVENLVSTLETKMKECSYFPDSEFE